MSVWCSGNISALQAFVSGSIPDTDLQIGLESYLIILTALKGKWLSPDT